MPDFDEIFSYGEEMRHQAFLAGARAAEQCKPKSSCPYPDESALCEDWLDGWRSDP